MLDDSGANRLAQSLRYRPSCFRDYASDNLVECQRALALTAEEIVSLVRNGFTTASITPAERMAARAKVDKYVSRFNWRH